MEHEEDGAKGIQTLVQVVISVVDVVTEMAQYGGNYHHSRLCTAQAEGEEEGKKRAREREKREQRAERGGKVREGVAKKERRRRGSKPLCLNSSLEMTEEINTDL